MSTTKSYSGYDFSRVNFNYHSPKPGCSYLHRASFVYLHETLKCCEKMYHAIEESWKEQGYLERTGRGFYKDYKSGIKQIKAQSTKLKNKGFPLTNIAGRSIGEDLNDAELMDLIQDLQKNSQQSDSFQRRTMSGYVPNGF